MNMDNPVRIPTDEANSVGAHLSRIAGISSPQAAMKQVVRVRLRTFFENGGSLDLPVDLKSLSSFFGVRTVSHAKNLRADAMLIPQSGGFVVRLRSPPVSLGRLRFSWAHELAHSIFFERKDKLPTRVVPTGTDLEERLCDLAAREILLPESSVSRGFESLRPRYGTSELVSKMAKLAEVSPQVIASRLVELALLDDTVIAGWLRTSEKRRGATYALSWVVYPVQSSVQLLESVKMSAPSLAHKAQYSGCEVVERYDFPWIRPSRRREVRATPFSQRMVITAFSTKG